MDLIIAIIIGAILWVLYHKRFHVVYFGGTFYQIISEMFTCLVLGYVIVLFGISVLGVVLSVLITIIGYLLLGVAVIFGIWAIYKIIKAIVIHIKKKNGTYVEKTEDHTDVAPDEVIVEDTIQEQSAEDTVE